ncbi:endonuclease/exonuclease/phosphatase family protein [Mucilaginibacter sp. McL0603]|uniref:endonuclease/exonuclease/phosphatase family protein n=1 Tax=Mucilaginibacter sp. McL0603 TaxID=3415670 RepID=UPI003CF3EDD5
MRIIAWNCNMAFRKKADQVLRYKPDILIISECEHPDKLTFPDPPTGVVWHGDNQHKGLGVFSFGDYQLKLLPDHTSSLKTILPISVTGANSDFTLFAIWANNPLDKGNQYVGQVWKAIHHYEHLIKPEKTILAGDFNSNSIWDKPRRIGNHTALVDALDLKGIKSIYHHHGGHLHGKEPHPTFNLYKNADKPYHLDYCFASEDFILKLADIEIGNYNDWKKYSDHLPLIINFDI